jgi:hypothetical protein
MTVPRVHSPDTHHYVVPIVRELLVTTGARRPSQRELVVASLLRCDRKKPSTA